MTIEDLIKVVNDETGAQAQPESRIDALVSDSLEFLQLIIRVSKDCGDIPDAWVSRIETVNDLFRAASGDLN